MPDAADVVVIGAGAVGCSAAYYLSLQGLNVTLLERDAIGSGASAHATGFLSLLGGEFSEGPSFQFGLAAYREFSTLVPQLEAATGIDLLCQRRPSLRLALDEEEAQLIQESMLWQQEHVAMSWVHPSEIRKIEPRITPNVLGGVYEEESTQLDSYRLTLALAQAAEQNGAALHLRAVTGLLTEGSRVVGVKTDGGDILCASVVLAAGTWSSDFGDDLGFPIPVRPLKGERLQLKFGGPALEVLISSPKRGHMISRRDGFLSVGSTGGRDYDTESLFWGEEFDRQPTEAAKIELLNRAIDVLPELERAELVRQIAGSRPLSPDRLPIIGPVPGWEGIVLATGHTTKGIHLGPITGKVIAEFIAGGSHKMPTGMGIFLPDRFAGIAGDFYASSRMVEE